MEWPTWDYSLGKRIFFATQASSAQRTIATIVTLSVDEAVWFTMPVFLFCSQALLAWGPDWMLGASVELLGDVMMCCMLELALKFAFKRTRPTYAAQSSFYILPGEWWSFPSGHTMRAAYLVRQLQVNPSVSEAVLGSAPEAVSSLVYWSLSVWAVAVGWSRVAKARHFPTDVAAGLAFGVLAADLRALVGIQAWCGVKLLAGGLTCAALGVEAVQPEMRLEGFAAHFVLQCVWFASQPYGFGLALTWRHVVALAVPTFSTFVVLGRLFPERFRCCFRVS